MSTSDIPRGTEFNLSGKQYELQTILVPKDKFTLQKAIQWVKDNEYKVKKVDETTNYYRFRQNPVIREEGIKFFSKLLPNGIELVFQYL